ncbi:hypothetical protein RDV89_10655 [Nocardioides zeae]|uniref:Transcriptional regulator, AbiEi antitoxin, Type IV TA system n=1 Tax=Nocardioides imazamoxiresistens TaxID=3231893 RepID=A0ABU3PWC4_9ACTN|nr:hypothetical protein [Nocardioides zeae]MDT9593528.1 hypothetical protein [Nocardioides zeae]
MNELLPDLALVVARRTVFLRKEALAAGYDESTIQRFTRTGQWRRVRPGAFVTQDVWSGLDDRRMHVLRAKAVAARSRAASVCSHTTSVVLLGGSTYNLVMDDVHVSRDKGKAGRFEAGVRRHRVQLDPVDVTVTDGLSHTVAARAVLEVLSISNVDTALCVANDFLHRGLVTIDELAAHAEVTRHWPGTLASDLLLLRADRRMESVAETLLDNLCYRHGVHGGQPQYEIRHEGQFLGRVDRAFPELGVWVEVDGRAKYTDFRREGQTLEDVLIAEKNRQNLIAAYTGWECVRLTWADLMRPARTAELLKAALERGRRRMKAGPPVLT